MKFKDIQDRTLGDLVTEKPGIIPVLNRYKLDYCCGGKDTLIKAIDDSNQDAADISKALERVLNETDASEQPCIEWNTASRTDLVEHILKTHHVFMKHTLAELNDLMFTILKVHFKNNGDTLLRVHRLFGTLKTELEAHLVKEEENLFPMIMKYDRNESGELKSRIHKFIYETEDEHDAAGEVFKELARITEDYSPPEGACGSFRRAYHLLDALEKDTFNHIHMENTILFGKI